MIRLFHNVSKDPPILNEKREARNLKKKKKGEEEEEQKVEKRTQTIKRKSFKQEREKQHLLEFGLEHYDVRGRNDCQTELVRTACQASSTDRPVHKPSWQFNLKTLVHDSAGGIGGTWLQPSLGLLAVLQPRAGYEQVSWWIKDGVPTLKTKPENNNDRKKRNKPGEHGSDEMPPGINHGIIINMFGFLGLGSQSRLVKRLGGRACSSELLQLG